MLCLRHPVASWALTKKCAGEELRSGRGSSPRMRKKVAVGQPTYRQGSRLSQGWAESTWLRGVSQPYHLLFILHPSLSSSRKKHLENIERPLCPQWSHNTWWTAVNGAARMLISLPRRTRPASIQKVRYVHLGSAHSGGRKKQACCNHELPLPGIHTRCVVSSCCSAVGIRSRVRHWTRILPERNP